MTGPSPAPDDLWIFGYGSLVWRPDFPFAQSRFGFVTDWVRRFWQGSTDHRGSPEYPGRVVTLVHRPGARCWGTVYRVHPRDREQVLAHLDHRERGGFDREEMKVEVRAGDGRSEQLLAQVYLATSSNPNYLGPDSLEAIAAQVRAAVGPSGPNLEYLLELAKSLRAMGAEDEHVFRLESLAHPGKR